jgi:hypothetical protein
MHLVGRYIRRYRPCDSLLRLDGVDLSSRLVHLVLDVVVGKNCGSGEEMPVQVPRVVRSIHNTMLGFSVTLALRAFLPCNVARNSASLFPACKHHRPSLQVRSSRVRAEHSSYLLKGDLLASRSAPRKATGPAWTDPWLLCQNMACPCATSGFGSNFLARCIYHTGISARKPPEGTSNCQKSPEKRMLIPPNALAKPSASPLR